MFEENEVISQVLAEVITKTAQKDHNTAQEYEPEPENSINTSSDTNDEINNILDDINDNIEEVSKARNHFINDHANYTLNDINNHADCSRNQDIEAEAESTDDNEFVVEKITQKKFDSRGHSKYLVKWQGFPASDNTWEPEENLADCDKKMEIFEFQSAEKLTEKHASEDEESRQTTTKQSKRRLDQFLKEWEINDVMGLTVIAKEKYFLVSLANSTQKMWIRASLANQIIPGKVIDFYIKSLRWKHTTELIPT